MFSNDPATFLEFAQNPANEAEMIRLGLKSNGVPEIKEENILSKAQKDDKEPVKE